MLEYRLGLVADTGQSPYHLTHQGRVFWTDWEAGVDCLYLEGPPPFPLLCEGDQVAEPAGAVLTQVDQFLYRGPLRLAVAGRALLPERGVEIAGIWAGSPLRPVVLEGDPAPDLEGVEFDFFQTVRLNAQGTICFAAVLQGAVGSVDRHSYWCARSGLDPELVARLGDQAPGRPNGETMIDFEVTSGLDLDDVHLDDLGFSHLQIETTAGHGFFRLTPHGGDDLAFQGESPPQSSLVYSGFDGNPLGDEPAPRGQNGSGVAFTCRLGQTAADPDDNSTSAVFSRAGTGAFRLVAQTGDLLPGGATMGLALGFATNARGNVVFEDNEFLTGSDRALYTDRSGVLEKLLEIGDPAPGAANPTAVFEGFTNFVINASRQVVLRAEISAPGPGTHSSLWVLDPFVGPILVAEEGSPIDFGVGGVRTPTSFSFPSADSFRGLSSSYNDLAQFVFAATFDDGSEGFVVARARPTTFLLLDGFESGDLSAWS